MSYDEVQGPEAAGHCFVTIVRVIKVMEQCKGCGRGVGRGGGVRGELVGGGG